MAGKKKSKKKMGLTSKIFISLIAGAILGVILHYVVPESYIRDTVLINGIFYVVGNGFLRLMQMLVVPLVFCSLICGSAAIGDTKTLGKVGVKTLGFYMLTTALAVVVALSLANVINPGIGLNMSEISAQETTVAESVSFADTLLNIIPKNPIQGLAEGNMLQIILFALIIGIILAKMGEKTAAVSNFFSQFNEIMMEMTMMVMSLAPFGVFCLIAKTFSGIGFDAFLPLLKYMFGVILALIVQCFVVYMLMLKIFTGLNPIKFIKKFFPVMTFAFSTATSNATIPLSIDTLDEKIGVPLPFRWERRSIWMVRPLCRALLLCLPPRLLEFLWEYRIISWLLPRQRWLRSVPPVFRASD